MFGEVAVLNNGVVVSKESCGEMKGLSRTDKVVLAVFSTLLSMITLKWIWMCVLYKTVRERESSVIHQCTSALILSRGYFTS